MATDWMLRKGKIVHGRDVIFDETKFPTLYDSEPAIIWDADHPDEEEEHMEDEQEEVDEG